MDIRAMTCFVAVAEDLHFRRAAERLHLTQPSISQRIRALENEIGTDLFARDRRSVALTPAGQAFLDPARRAIENARVAILPRDTVASAASDRCCLAETPFTDDGQAFSG